MTKSNFKKSVMTSFLSVDGYIYAKFKNLEEKDITSHFVIYYITAVRLKPYLLQVNNLINLQAFCDSHR